MNNFIFFFVEKKDVRTDGKEEPVGSLMFLIECLGKFLVSLDKFLVATVATVFAAVVAVAVVKVHCAAVAVELAVVGCTVGD